jgi:hypothetical protein
MFKFYKLYILSVQKLEHMMPVTEQKILIFSPSLQNCQISPSLIHLDSPNPYPLHILQCKRTLECHHRNARLAFKSQSRCTTKDNKNRIFLDRLQHLQHLMQPGDCKQQKPTLSKLPFPGPDGSLEPSPFSPGSINKLFSHDFIKFPI